MSVQAPHVRCPECGAEIAPGLLACPGCARLVHAVELKRLASAAQAAESAGDATGALAHWRRAIELLPIGTAQQATIHGRMVALSAAIDGRGSAQPAVIKPAANGRARAGAAAGA
ncbi:MAG TPA: hypothetical protein VGY54_09690, partial [Polyangiaceae bacterium]|nr:hypothetical protein [Polyangiaceae bacterium]